MPKSKGKQQPTPVLTGRLQRYVIVNAARTCHHRQGRMLVNLEEEQVICGDCGQQVDPAICLAELGATSETFPLLADLVVKAGGAR